MCEYMIIVNQIQTAHIHTYESYGLICVNYATRKLFVLKVQHIHSECFSHRVTVQSEGRSHDRRCRRSLIQLMEELRGQRTAGSHLQSWGQRDNGRRQCFWNPGAGATWKNLEPWQHFQAKAGTT